MLIARVPESSRTSTLSIRGMLDTSAIFFLMYSFSVAFWKYLDFAILSTNLKILLLVLPPVCLGDDKDKGTKAVKECESKNDREWDILRNSENSTVNCVNWE